MLSTAPSVDLGSQTLTSSVLSGSPILDTMSPALSPTEKLFPLNTTSLFSLSDASSRGAGCSSGAEVSVSGRVSVSGAAVSAAVSVTVSVTVCAAVSAAVSVTAGAVSAAGFEELAVSPQADASSAAAAMIGMNILFPGLIFHQLSLDESDTQITFVPFLATVT